MDIQKAINVIDKVSTLIVEKVPPYFVAEALNGKLDEELYQHMIDKWYSKKEDLFDFYLNSSSEVQRYLLEALDIVVEPDKYPDYESRVLAWCKDGKSRWEVYPFETEILYRFILFGHNNGLEVLKDISSSAWGTVEEYGIDPYGNTLNWSEFWFDASKEDKIELIEYLIKEKELIACHPEPECRKRGRLNF